MDNWIKINSNDDLPKEVGPVIGCILGHVGELFYIGEGYFESGSGIIFRHGQGKGCVSHWMPMPKPPRKELL